MCLLNTKSSTISKNPKAEAAWIGVHSLISAALGDLVNELKNLAISFDWQNFASKSVN